MKIINSAKYSLTALLAAAMTSIASAQISPRPASWNSAGDDGLNQFTSTLNASQVAAFTAAGVNIASDGTIALPSGFIQGTPTLALNSSTVAGSVNVLFLGESAGWRNDLGYVRNPQTANLANPAAYIPLVVNIDSSLSGTPTANNLVNNTYTTLSYGAGEKLDFFLNAVGDGSGTTGGTWFTFGAPNQFNGSDNTIHTKYTYLSIDDVSTAAYDPVSTLVVAFEDARFSSIDGDFSDVLIAFQGVGSNPVPEPSTYGMIGAAALLSLVALRRFKRKAA